MGNPRGAQFASTAAASIHAISEASSFEDLDKAASIELRRLGLDLTVGAIVQRGPSLRQDVGFLFGQTDHPWIQHYRDAGLGGNCAVTGSAGPRLLAWADVKSKPLTEDQRTQFDHLRAFQLLDGCIVGVESLGQTMVVVSCAGRDADLCDPYTRSLAHLISVNYGVLALAHWRARNQLAEPEHHALTHRQVDCLRWVLEGKSSGAIGGILGVSARTVDEHLEKACVALGVRTRIQACAQALRLGLVSH